MINVEVSSDNDGKQRIKTSLSGKDLLTNPQLNKSTAFTAEERRSFGLIGKLPYRVETLDEQLDRAYQQYLHFEGNLQKNIYLNALLDINQHLFFALVSRHLEEMMPMIYTPIVGNAVKQFSKEFRRPRGLYISYPDREHIRDMLRNRTNPHIDLIVVTDGEGVLGIGDQGIGGMDIPIAKLMVYTLCGGISPFRTLPIQLDVGTNNETLLNDPLYLGWREKRINKEKYDAFIRMFIDIVKEEFPNLYLHWEDLGTRNARYNLEKYRKELCTFNDDMQGTGVVTLAVINAATKALNEKMSDHRVVVYGAGAAGTGIAEQIYDVMRREGLSHEEAKSKFWLIDRYGLIKVGMDHLNDAKRFFARDPAESADWAHGEDGFVNLATTVDHIKPTILIGCSAQSGAFTESIVKNIAAHVEHPIILPLSNPTEKAEATPKDIMHWTNNKAYIATGSPFAPVKYEGISYRIAQCNNALVFPGIGLGVLACRATRLTDNMLWAACEALSVCSPVLSDPTQPVLPTLREAPEIAKKIAAAVMRQAMDDGVADEKSDAEIETLIQENFWQPEYLPYELMG